MKSVYKILIILEVQVLLVLSIVLMFKFISIEDKIYNTNKFVYNLLHDKKLSALNMFNENDILIGDPNAPVSMYMYSRVDCSVCNHFFSENFVSLKEEYINPGKLNLVIRFLVHPSKPKVLNATKFLKYAYKIGVFEEYSEYIRNSSLTLDSVDLAKGMNDYVTNAEDLSQFIEDKSMEEDLLSLANEIRSVGVRSTPTFFINNQRIVGDRNYQKFKAIIEEEIENSENN